MASLDAMLRRNKDFAAQQSVDGALMPSLPPGAHECEGNHNRLRRYACGPGSRTWN